MFLLIPNCAVAGTRGVCRHHSAVRENISSATKRLLKKYQLADLIGGHSVQPFELEGRAARGDVHESCPLFYDNIHGSAE